MQITTCPSRIAFPQLVEPDEQFGKYSCCLIFAPTETAEIRAALRQALIEDIPDQKKWPPIFRNIDMDTYLSATGKDGWPLRDGNAVSWDGFGGKVFLKASSKYQPVVVDANKNIIQPDLIKSGMLVRARLAIKTYEVSGSRGIGVYVQAIQLLLDDGVRFGASVTDYFDDEVPF